jgi:hypothetical protein
MEDQLISFETAKLAKEKGFREKSMHWYNSSGLPVSVAQPQSPSDDKRFPSYSRPTQSLLQRWLREKHRIDIDCSCDYERILWKVGHRMKGYGYHSSSLMFISYEAALEKGLQQALKLIPEKEE